MTADALHLFLERYAKLKEDQSLRPGKDILTAEFQKIKRASEQLLAEGQTVANYGAKEVNRRKNRYKDILPFDHSRVNLQRKGNQFGSDYINANYIMSPIGKKGYIASQGPMPATVNDFWRMILEHKVQVIVMACKEIELGKHRCQRYWAEKGEQLNFDGITVSLVKEVLVSENLIERTLNANSGKESQNIVQLHYTAWPDHGVPKTTDDLIKLIGLMREQHPWDDPPVLLHCSAGCGRTGVMIAVDYGRRLIRAKPKTFDVYDIVMTLRQQRPAMVQSKEQYEYLHEVFKDIITEIVSKSASFTSSSYINYDVSAIKETIPLYENIDAAPGTSPTRSRRREVSNADNAKGFYVQKNLAGAKKPLITNNVSSPQKALINTEFASSSPKPVPKPVKVLNLIDNDPNFPSDSQLKSPLLPSSPKPVSSKTVELRRPASAKDFTAQNYINYEPGQCKLPSQRIIPGEKPQLPPRSLERSSDRPAVSTKPIVNCYNGINTPQVLSERPVIPKQQLDGTAKPTRGGEPVGDGVNGGRPCFPLKTNAFPDFDLFSSEIRDDQFQSSKMSPISKSRTWESSGPKHVASGATGSKPDQDYAVPSFFASKAGNNAKADKASSYSVQQPLRSDRLGHRAASSSNIIGRTDVYAHKVPTKSDFFLPLQPSSSVITSSTASRDKAPDRLVLLRNNNEKDSLDRNDECRSGRVAVGDDFQTRDGLVRRTNQSVVRGESQSGGQVQSTNYLVSIQKAAPKPEIPPQERPVPRKAFSPGSISQMADPNAVQRAQRFLSEGAKSPLFDRRRDDVDGVNEDGLYASVDKVPQTTKDASLYEMIWTDAKPKPNICQKPQLNLDVPPLLPPRTAESYMFEDEEDGQASQKHADTQDSSFQWFSASVDKLKKLTNIKGAFAVGIKQNSKQGSQSDISNSAFYTRSHSAKDATKDELASSRGAMDRTFPHRLQQKPRGSRPIPSHWTPI